MTVSGVGLRRRIFPWPHDPAIRIGDPAIQRVMDATVNTLNNSAQDLIVDGMGRERQQYSGDCGHQLHAVMGTFGETRLPRRFLITYSQGLSSEGYFLDCWPAYDRLARVMQKQLGLSNWGPLLDHGVVSYSTIITTIARPATRPTWPRRCRACFVRSITSPR